MRYNPRMHLITDLGGCVKSATRDGFGKGLTEVGSRKKNVVALAGDLTESVRMEAFKEKYPSRYVEVGIAEQNLLGIATGLAFSGKIPFTASFAVFSPGRNWDQLRVSVCYSNANVKVVGSHAGITTGPDGGTHQALEDIAITRCLPNLTVLVPADAEEARKATIAAANHRGPVYLRIGRAKFPVFTTEKTPFMIGKANVLRRGEDVTIIACGIMVYEALLAAEALWKKNISAEVINCHTIKPMDERAIVASAKKTGAVVTAEEHQITGGLGGAVAEVLAKKQPTPMRMVGVNDRFGESGTSRELLDAYNLTAKQIVKEAAKVIKDEE